MQLPGADGSFIQINQGRYCHEKQPEFKAFQTGLGSPQMALDLRVRHSTHGLEMPFHQFSAL